MLKHTQRIFIAQGNGVTIDYIMNKGSACVEVFRSAAHLVAGFFGDPDRNRRSKEISFLQDMRVLVEDMESRQLHRGFREHQVPKPIRDPMVLGAESWSNGLFDEFKASTTYDPALGHPVFKSEDFDSDDEDDTPLAQAREQVAVDEEEGGISLSYNTAKDLLSDDIENSAIGGGGEFDKGSENL